MIRFFSDALGESYIRPARALLRSFSALAPGMSICVFTENPELFPKESAIYARFDELLDWFDPFHQAKDGQIRKAFKFVLFEGMSKLYLYDDLCWVDADMLVFVDLSNHITTGKINVMARSRRNQQTLELGDGLSVRGDR